MFDTLGQFVSESMVPYFVLFFSGVAASFTPCVYPVLPLTVGYVGSVAGESKLKAFLTSLALVLGMALVYAVLGVILAAVGVPFGSLMSKGWFLYAVATFFVLMSLFLMDVFPFPVPRFISNLSGKAASRRRSIAGALLVGGVSGLVVGPCTGPIIGMVFVYIVASLREAQGAAYVAQVVNGGIKLSLFGLGQGTLVLLCGTFSGLLSHLPKSGKWMIAVKKGFALLMLAAASLLFVLVGQNTDFPSLTGLLGRLEAGSSAPAPDAGGWVEARPIAQRVGNEAVGFSLYMPDGEIFTLSEQKGKRGVVLVFFATWCAPCMAEVSQIKVLAERAKAHDVLVVGVNQAQPVEVVRRFIGEYGVNYPVLLDLRAKVHSA